MTGRTRPLAVVDGLLPLAQRQLGVVSRAQLAALGVTRHHVRRQVEAQRWAVVGPRVVVLMTGALSREQERWVAVHHAGTGSALAGRSGLEHLGLRGWESDTNHLVVPHDTRVPPLPGLALHRTRVLEPHDVRIVQGIRCTTAARAAVDAASWERSTRSATGIVIAVVQQRLVTPSEITGVLDARPLLRHSVAIRAVLADVGAGADSRAEVDVAHLMRRAGFRKVRRQVVITTPDGPRRVDLATELPDGSLLIVEVDGPHHADARQRRQDAVKDAAAVAAGHRVLRIPVVDVRTDPHQVLAQLRAIHRGVIGGRNAS